MSQDDRFAEHGVSRYEKYSDTFEKRIEALYQKIKMLERRIADLEAELKQVNNVYDEMPVMIARKGIK